MSLPLAKRIELIQSLDPEETLRLYYDWDVWVLQHQLEPLDWALWVIKAGRGSGKTRTGAETVRKYREAKRANHIALVGPTAADARDVMLGMNPESSGLLQVCPPWNKPIYEPSKRRAIWPDGGVATLYSAEEPDRLRGPEHDFGWGDEPAAWPDGDDVLLNLMMGLRQGEAKAIFTTTPRPTAFMRKLLHMEGVVVSEGTMRDNPFLADEARKRIIAMYAGTRLGLQEIEGRLLVDNPDALWTYEMIENDRISIKDFAEAIAPALHAKPTITITRTVVAIDPAVTSNKKSNETGIIVACIDNQKPSHAYILRDATLVARPEQWAEKAVSIYKEYGADRAIGEVNNGGDLIESVLRNQDSSISYATVRATKGKMLRAEPISALYEKHRVHHIGSFPQLEQQMTEYDGNPKTSPDRFDALVWALTYLQINNKSGGKFFSW